MPLSSATNSPRLALYFAIALIALSCYWVMKNVRQKAGLITLQDPKAAAIANEIRAKAQEVLRAPSAVESARR